MVSVFVYECEEKEEEAAWEVILVTKKEENIACDHLLSRQRKMSHSVVFELE